MTTTLDFEVIVDQDPATTLYRYRIIYDDQSGSESGYLFITEEGAFDAGHAAADRHVEAFFARPTFIGEWHPRETAAW